MRRDDDTQPKGAARIDYRAECWPDSPHAVSEEQVLSVAATRFTGIFNFADKAVCAALLGIVRHFSAPAPRTACEYCDGTGDVHSLDGEWRGVCTECPAGEAPDGAHEALQRLIENAASLGPASRDDARLVAKWRRPLLSPRPFQSPAVAPASDLADLIPQPQTLGQRADGSVILGYTGAQMGATMRLVETWTRSRLAVSLVPVQGAKP